MSDNQEKLLQQKKDIVQAYKTLFAYPEAKLVTKDLELFTGYHGILFFRDSERMTVFTLGLREVLKHINEMINTNFEDIKPKESITEKGPENG